VKPGEQTLLGSVKSTDVTGTYTTMVGGAAHEPPARASSSRSIPVKKGER
jgi:hypothetical protein